LVDHKNVRFSATWFRPIERNFGDPIEHSPMTNLSMAAAPEMHVAKRLIINVSHLLTIIVRRHLRGAIRFQNDHSGGKIGQLV
jgi:hypothetical protein